MTSGSISHSLTVEAAPQETFDGFTKHLGDWWPLAYTFGMANFAGAAIKERAGGEWFERDTAGKRMSWGTVRAFEPPDRLVVSFAIGADRGPVPESQASEVEIRFEQEEQDRTRITIEHRGFDRHGKDADVLQNGMDSAGGWPLILAEFRRWLTSRPHLKRSTRA